MLRSWSVYFSKLNFLWLFAPLLHLQLLLKFLLFTLFNQDLTPVLPLQFLHINATLLLTSLELIYLLAQSASFSRAVNSCRRKCIILARHAAEVNIAMCRTFHLLLAHAALLSRASRIIRYLNLSNGL